MNSGKIDITVIVPVYNAIHYLQKCIDSILDQSFINFELLLINDGSTDGSDLICNFYSERDTRIRVFHKKNEGVSSARNIGIINAKGKWISFIDADDYILPNALLTFFENSYDTDWVLANSYRLEENRKNLIYSWKDKDFIVDLLKIKHFALWGYLFNASIIKAKKILFNENLAYSEDRLFILQYAIFSNSLFFLAEPIYVYRIHNNSVCKSNNGLKKAKHQFYAANQISLLANSYKNLSKNKYNILLKEKRNILNLGIYQFLEQPYTFSTFQKLKNYYIRFYNSHILLFYFLLVYNFFKIKRRRIIKFRKY